MILDLQATDDVRDEDMAEIAHFLGTHLPFKVRRRPTLPVPEHAHDETRDQFDGTVILRAALEGCADDADRLLVLTGHDLFIPMLTFIFGQAQLDGTAAVVSTARLRPEYHGLPPRRGVFMARLVKEILHELGHTFGLTHCDDAGCTMSLSIKIADIDAKRARFCRRCSGLVNAKLAALKRPREAPRRES